jgi:hypothetical protein
MRLPDGAVVAARVWWFDSIRNARARGVIEEHLTEADLLMVAAHGRQPFPRAIEIALGEWLWGAARKHFGLVALLRGISDVQKRNVRAHVFLEALATKAGADFLSHAEEEGALPRKDAAKSILSGVPGFFWGDDLPRIEVPPRSWGINE